MGLWNTQDRKGSSLQIQDKRRTGSAKFHSLLLCHQLGGAARWVKDGARGLFSFLCWCSYATEQSKLFWKQLEKHFQFRKMSFPLPIIASPSFAPSNLDGVFLAWRDLGICKCCWPIPERSVCILSAAQGNICSPTGITWEHISPTLRVQGRTNWIAV